jgi:acyl-CoA thioester hydrolase
MDELSIQAMWNDPVREPGAGVAEVTLKPIMKPMPRTFKTRLRVRYAETDQMGVVYHANYLVWFEVGRVELMRELGFAYAQMEAEEGCALPVVEVNCRYRSPARYDDELVLETRLTSLRGPVLKFSYQLRRAALAGAGEGVVAAVGGASPALPAADGGELLAEAVTTHVVVDRNLKSCPLPERYLGALQEILGRVAVG